jgi:signal transduction histidine kinase
MTDERISALEEMAAALRAEQERLELLQATIRQMLAEPDLNTNLAAVTQTLQSLGWQRVMVELLADEANDRQVLLNGQAVHDGDDAIVLPQELWDALEAGHLEPYRRGGVYFIPQRGGASDTWHAGDVVFAPLKVSRGTLVGIVRVDDPVHGRRPSWEELRPLDILAAQTAYIVENARLLQAVSRTAEELAEQVEELSMIHRADRELSAHLNLDHVMRLTMDWALRRTGADTGLLMLMTDDRTGLAPYIVTGYVDRQAFPYDAHNPLPLSEGVIGRAARTGQTQVVHQVTAEEDRLPFIPNARMHVSVPLSMRGQALGVITLASVHDIVFGDDEVSFLERLGRRAAVALDNARLYRRTEQLANDMAALYNASRAITSTLNRDEVLRRIARAMTETLECSSTVIYDYKPETQGVQVLAVHRAGADLDGQEVLPPLKHTIPLAMYPAFQTVVEQQHSLALRAADLSLSTLDRSHLIEDRIHAMVLVPLVAQDELMGVAAVIEGRYDRVFTASEVYKAEALASQAAIALRQALLFSEIKELETLKSEMIRMASHDLRNPLNNVMGYAELLAMSLEELGCMTPTQQMYLQNLRASTEIMKTLLEDLLTLERIESERQAEWQTFDFGGLVIEVVDSQQASADLKGQSLRLLHEPGTLSVHGSVTQLRQAVANLVSNAIKYTPQGGHIEVTVGVEEEERVAFKVTDDGYGISPERQARIFERFYRAREPGTEHISGTGLGLSLVKTVVERHGGQVWFSSTPGKGSTFGFWLPLAG